MNHPPRTRRDFMLAMAAVAGSAAIVPKPALANGRSTSLDLPYADQGLIRLSFNENPYGPSPLAVAAIQRELQRLNRYGDDVAAQTLIERIAHREQIDPEQVVLGEVLGALGSLLAEQGGVGSEFIYSTPGYLALVDATSQLGGVSVPVPLNADLGNDLPAIASRVGDRTRGVYLVNPHNPSGTVSDNAGFKRFLSEIAQRSLVIVDEAYLEYTTDFSTRSAVDLVRAGANVAVFRTFAKIHALAGLPFGYLLAPREVAGALRRNDIGGGEDIGRLALAAAAGALQDTDLIARSQLAVAHERELWHQTLDQLGLQHSHSVANYVFFNAKRPQSELAAAFRQHGFDIGRAFPPLNSWTRISIGLPAENARAREVLRAVISV